MTALSFFAVRTSLLTDVSVVFEAGLHAVLSEGPDGGADLALLAAGASRPKRGRVTLDGQGPYERPELRRRIGSLLAEERFAGEHSVKGAVSRVLSARGDTQSPNAVLASCDLDGWAARGASSLSPREARAVALALAISTPRPRLLALVEPLSVGLDRSWVLNRLREHAALGAVVLVVTASASDALLVTADVKVVDRGRLVGRLAGPALREAPVPAWVKTSDPEGLSAALAKDPAVTRVDVDDRYGTREVIVHGVHRDETALAILRAARVSRAAIHWITDRASRPQLALPGDSPRRQP